MASLFEDLKGLMGLATLAIIRAGQRKRFLALLFCGKGDFTQKEALRRYLGTKSMI